jgi:hypothetical protein
VGDEKAKFFVGKPEGKRPLERSIGVDRKTILEWTLRKEGGKL